MMQKPQRPRKREDELGSRSHDWHDWEKRHNEATGMSNNRMFDVYQRNENLRVRNSSKIQSIQEEIEKMEKMNRKEIETLREEYKLMMAYAYVYKIHSIGQDPDNDELPLIRKRLQVQPAQSKPIDPDLQILPENILEYYGDRPKSVRLPPVEKKWRPVSFSRNPTEDNKAPGYEESWITDPYPTLKPEDILSYTKDRENEANEMEKNEHMDGRLRLPAIGTLALKLSNWRNFGNQKGKNNGANKYTRNAFSEPPSRWRGRETEVKKEKRPKSYAPNPQSSPKTPGTSKKFYDKEAKKALSKFTFSHKRFEESKKILSQMKNPWSHMIDSQKPTSAILKEYRQKQHEVKRGPIKVPHNPENLTKMKQQHFQNWVFGNSE